MAAATGTVVISQAGSNFDSADFPRFVLGDGTNSITFVIDNDGRGLKLTGGSDASGYTGASDLPFEDSQKTRLVVPTFDESDGAKKALLSWLPTDPGNLTTAWNSIDANAAGNSGLTAITARPHYVITDTSGNTVKVGFGSATATSLTNQGAVLVAKYGSSGSPRYWVYREGSSSDNYFIRVVNTGTNGWKLNMAFYACVKHAYNNSLINVNAQLIVSSGALQEPGSVANDTYTSTEAVGVLLEAKTAGFAGNACNMMFKDPGSDIGASDNKRVSWGYDEFATSATLAVTRHTLSPTNDQFWHTNEDSRIYFRQGTIAGSGSDASLTTANIAEAIKEMVNGSILGITATRDGSTVNLTNDTDGDSGNVTITTTNAGSLFSVTGMSNAGGGEEEDDVARRSTISADQLALSSSGGLASSSDSKSAIKIDLSGSLAALGASPNSADILAVAHRTTGVVTKITVAELVGSVAAGSDTQVQFNDGGSSLGGDSGLTYNKTTDTLSVGNDLKLTSDSAILSLGAGDDATLTHDGTTGLTIAATPISIDSTGELHLNSTTGDIKFQDGGADQLALDLDGTAGEIIMQLKVDSDDFVFKQFDGTEVFRVEDDGSFDIAGGAGSSGVTVSAAGQLTADGRILVDDATDATSTTDGSLQTDGGLSVVKDIIAGNDVKLLSDSAVLAMGAGSDITLTHDGSTGGTLASAGAFLIDGANAVSIDGASGVNIGTNDSGAAISIGHSTSEVTVNDNLTVTGDLTVNGTTTTIDTTNLLVEDPIVLLNKNNSSANGQGGIAIENGGSSADMVFGRVANDTWGVGTKDTSAGAVTTLADMTLGAFRAGKLEIDGANDYIDVDTDLKIIAAADVVVDPGGGELKVDGNVVPNSDSADSLGASGTAWANLYVDAIDLNGQGSISMGGTGRIDLDADDDTSIRASADDVITFEVGGSDLVDIKAAGLQITDDKKLMFGAASGGDAHFEYDEDGNDVLNYGGSSMRFADDTKLEFGAAGDASFEYDEDGNDVLLYAGAAMRIGDDIQLQFGAGGDAAIEYDEDGTDQLRIHQPAAGVVIAGTSPKLVLGDAGAEDTMLVFDGNAQDYRIGLDDGTDVLEFGVGSAHGSTISMKMDSSLNVDIAAHDGSVGLKLGGTLVAASAAELNTVADVSAGGSHAADIDVSADHFLFRDGGNTGTHKVESFADLATAQAGAGLQASAGAFSIASVEDHFVSSSSSGNGGLVFSLSQTPASNASVSVYINGIFQVQSGSLHASIAGGDYSISGTTVTLVDANEIDASDEVVVKYIQQ